MLPDPENALGFVKDILVLCITLFDKRPFRESWLVFDLVSQVQLIKVWRGAVLAASRWYFSLSCCHPPRIAVTRRNPVHVTVAERRDNDDHIVCVTGVGIWTEAPVGGVRVCNACRTQMLDWVGRILACGLRWSLAPSESDVTVEYAEEWELFFEVGIHVPDRCTTGVRLPQNPVGTFDSEGFNDVFHVRNAIGWSVVEFRFVTRRVCCRCYSLACCCSHHPTSV